MTEIGGIKPINILPFKLHDISDFKQEEYPKLHPESPQYERFWIEEAKKCIEGMWGYDFSEEKQEGGYRWCPGNLYFYVNMTEMEVDMDDNTKKWVKPLLRDVEWYIFYGLTACDGFSGFEEDEEYTCFRAVGKLQNKKEKLTVQDKYDLKKYEHLLKKENGEYKTYIDAVSYLYRTFDKPMGKALYYNEAKNLILLSTRRIGKSLSINGGCITYDFTFNGARTVSDYLNKKSNSTVVVGASDSGYTKELLSKFTHNYNYLKKEIGSYSDGVNNWNGCFWAPTSGSISKSNGIITNSVPEKSGQGYTGAGSKIVNVSYHNNPNAGVGYGARRMVVEECFSPETKIILADGSATEIKNVKVGDWVLQPDGSKAKVGRVTKGVDQMYTVSQKYGIDYIVNSKHLLHLEQLCKNPSIKDDGIKNIPAEKFNKENLGSYRLRTTRGIQSESIPYEEKSLPLDPYFVGSYIGDGTINKFGIVFNPDKDKEPMEWFSNYIESLGLEVSVYDCPGNAVFVTGVKKYPGQFYRHPIKEKMKNLGILSEKKIPDEYLVSSEDQRLQLLAGLIDTDGNVSINAKSTSYSYEISISKRADLKDQVVRLAKSLGFRVTVTTKTCNKEYDGKIIEEREKYVVRVRGDIWKIPVKVLYKKIEKHDWVSNWRRTPIKVEKSHIGEYVGITLDSDSPLFLLEDYTVVHNCGLLANFKDVHGENSATQKGTRKYGYSVYIGTGGNVEKIQAIREAFLKPESFDCLGYADQYTNSGNSIGMFIPCYYKNNQYRDEQGNLDVETSFESEMDIREAKKKEGSTAYEKHIISFPMHWKEMFMHSSGNIFPTDKLEARITDLETGLWEKIAQTGNILYYDKENTIAKFAPIPKDKSKVIKRWGSEKDFPEDERQGCIVIYEHPVQARPSPSFRDPLYIVSYDPVRTDKSLTGSSGTSLASVLVFKAWYLEDLESLQFNVVAEWIGRHNKLREDHEVAFKLATYYGAKILPEINNEDILRYAKNTSRWDMIHFKPATNPSEIIKTNSYKSKGVLVTKGMKPGLAEYANEVLKTVVSKQETIRGDLESLEEIKMVEEIPSLRLAEELLYYNDDDNFDHVSSFFLIGLWSRSQDIKPIQRDDEEEEDSTQSRYLNFIGESAELPYNPAFDY